MTQESGTGYLATFGAGCFWGVEEAFRHVKGVMATAAGYMGGTLDYPRYEDVCSGTTGHAEVVQVTYDPNIISYEKLLEVFWLIHDPTQLNRQGPDYGTNYRSVIFYHTPEQEAAARASRDRLQQTAAFRSKKIVTEIVPARDFWQAEEYHQWVTRHRSCTSCHLPDHRSR